MRLIILLLICLPLIEIAVLIFVGSKIGVLTTIALVILTGFVGTYLLRTQGTQAFSKLRAQVSSGQAPNKQLADAAMIVLAGILLILPGFVSDILGISLFVPFVRTRVGAALAKNASVVGRGRTYKADVVDLGPQDYQSMDDDVDAVDAKNKFSTLTRSDKKQ